MTTHFSQTKPMFAAAAALALLFSATAAFAQMQTAEPDYRAIALKWAKTAVADSAPPPFESCTMSAFGGTGGSGA